MTGEVVQVTSDLIVITRGNRRLEFTRNRSTKVAGDLKPGSQVTIRYHKNAISVEAGPGKSGDNAKP